MKITRLNYLTAVAFLTLLTTGCMPKITVVEPDDKPALNENVGYIALSSMCTGYDHAAIGVVESAHPLLGGDREGIYLDCDNQEPQYILLKKKPGEYDIGQIALIASAFSDPYVQKEESYARVIVKRGKVTYAGRINLEIEYPSGFYIKKQNAYADDIKNMKAIYKYINFNNTLIDVNPFKPL